MEISIKPQITNLYLTVSYFMFTGNMRLNFVGRKVSAELNRFLISCSNHRHWVTMRRPENRRKLKQKRV